MFSDLTRDDVFRLETQRLWLRWPRLADAAAIARYAGEWDVARHTARIPHPYPVGEAERFVHAAREANASGRDFILVLTPLQAPDRVLGAVSLESCAGERLALGYALAPAAWGRGLATEAVRAMLDAAFKLTRANAIEADARLDDAAARRVLEKIGFVLTGRGARDAPARGAMVECDAFAYTRADWTARRAALLETMS